MSTSMVFKKYCLAHYCILDMIFMPLHGDLGSLREVTFGPASGAMMGARFKREGLAVRVAKPNRLANFLCILSSICF
jgi:hypothetical protein